MHVFLTRRTALMALVVALIVAAFAPIPATAQTNRLKVVATTSILADLVKNVAGDKVDLKTLVPAGGDSHTFEPAPSDSIALAEAALIIENGLGLETWLEKLYVASGSKAARVVATANVAPLAPDIMLRLLVADHETRPVSLIDLGTGKVAARYDVGSPTYVYTSPSRRFGVKIQTNANVITAVDSGIVIEDHGDHMHFYKNDPKLTDFKLEGSTPIHFVAHDGQIAIFNDGSGTAVILTERNLRLPETEKITLKAVRPHHGVAIPLGDKAIISLPKADSTDALPIGVDLVDMTGKTLASFPECPGLHGEASTGNFIAFGCADRVLVLEKTGETYTAKSLKYPAGTPDNVRVGTLVAHEKQPYFIGNFGPQGMVRVDPAAGTLTPIELPMRYSGFQLDAETGAKIVTVTTDGKIHRIDAMTGTIEASLEVVTPFVFRTRVPRPGLAVAHQMAYVTDPASGEVVEVNLEEMTISRRFVTDGKPVRLAVIGLLEKEEHGEEHADHEHGMFDPHVWHDVKNVRQMVTNIRDALIRADAPNADTYRANAAAYLKQLDELDKFVVSEVAKIPAERRLLVTAHNTFSYFAERYGFKVVGTALGTTTDMADPAAGQLAELVKEIKESGVVAIFPENVSNTRLMEQIAREAGVKLAPPLITDALDTPGTPGDTYIGMIRYNVTTMVEALR